MSQILKVSISIVLLVGLVSASQVVTFTCRQVATSVCASGYQYRTQGSYETIVLDTTYCVPVNTTCVATTTQFNLQTCKIDYKAQTCSNGVCFMLPQKQICTLDMSCGNATSPLSYYANYKCDNCTDGSSCAKCFFVTTNQVNASGPTTSSCLGSSCTEGIATTTSTINRCTNGFDFLGQKCDCCITTQEISRFCSTNSPALSQADVTNWFNKVEGNTNSENKIQMIIGFIFLAILSIMH